MRDLDSNRGHHDFQKGPRIESPDLQDFYW